MNPNELRKRTKQFALRIINVVEALPKSVTGRAIGNQLVRCGTSVCANYKTAYRGRSKAESIPSCILSLKKQMKVYSGMNL